MNTTQVKRLIEAARSIKPATTLLTPSSSAPTDAQVGEVWFVKECPGEPDYSPLNPYCNTVIILRGNGGDSQCSLYRVAPVTWDVKYSGVTDAIFPSHVFGSEAVVSIGCEMSITDGELVKPIGTLPEEWMDRLAQFAAWTEERGEFPSRLLCGRPFTHPEDPGYIYHGNLCENMQHLMCAAVAAVCGDEDEEE